ncbi:DoxX family protein [Parapedobacter deserti]|uniref:DoxX family protein n=1 Tax=Parapedobacter deserti TaxID=1912957 RepID=A0ABV7JRC2_9SPHI
MKKNRIIFWIATIIILLWEGAMPLGSLLFAPDQATVGTRPLGYPDYFAYALIICKVLGALAISIPSVPAKLREWAYAGLTFNLIFAFISHAAVDRHIGFMLLPLVILGILAISYVYSQKLVRSGKTDYQTTDPYQLAVGGNR